MINMSYVDTYPTVKLESEAYGTPVICYDVAGCKEAIRMEQSKCVNVGDIEAILEALKQMKMLNAKYLVNLLVLGENG